MTEQTAETAFDELATELGEDGVTEGNLFGKPCLKLRGKAFVCLFKGALVFKLSGGEFDRAMALPGAVLFDPSGKGRPMREWVQVPSEGAREWRGLARAAVAYSQASQK